MRNPDTCADDDATAARGIDSLSWTGLEDAGCARDGTHWDRKIREVRYRYPLNESILILSITCSVTCFNDTMHHAKSSAYYFEIIISVCNP